MESGRAIQEVEKKNQIKQDIQSVHIGYPDESIEITLWSCQGILVTSKVLGRLYTG